MVRQYFEKKNGKILLLQTVESAFILFSSSIEDWGAFTIILRTV